MSPTKPLYNHKVFEPNDRVITPEGWKAEVFECSKMLGFTSVFVDGERRNRIYKSDDLNKDTTPSLKD